MSKVVFMIQKWWPDMVKYCKKYKPNQQTELNLFQDLLQFTKQIQTSLEQRTDESGNKFRYEIVDLKDKHLNKNNLIHKQEDIYNTNLSNKILDYILEQNPKLKLTTDSHPLNFLINPEYEKIQSERKNLFMKVDNELSKFALDAEHLNLLFYQPEIISSKTRKIILEPYLEDSTDLQIALLYSRMLSHMKGYLGVKNPNFKYQEQFLNNIYTFIKWNEHNINNDFLRVDLPSQINTFASNLPKIHEYLLSKKTS